MNDAVDSVLQERETLDRGFPVGVALSILGHLLLAGAAVALPILMPKPPLLKVAMGQMVVIPRGGGGSPSAGPAAETPPAPPSTQAPEPPRPEPPKLVKPPKEVERKGLADPSADKKKNKKPLKLEPRRAAANPTEAKTSDQKPAGTGATGSAASTTPGLGLAPAGPGAPGGTDAGGDWYLASVQRKIWMIWTQQIRSGAQPPVTVRFTILADGSVTGVEVVQSSGQYLLDQAAQRAVITAAPFSPLPRSYDTKAFTLQAVFQPMG